MLRHLMVLCILGPLVTSRHRNWGNRISKYSRNNLVGSKLPTTPAKWWYSEEASWPGEECKFGSARQSPIDIQTRHVIIDRSHEFFGPEPLKLAGYARTLVTALNNGHTVQFTTEGPESMHPTITGGPLKYVYRLEQIHFHWLSEHAIDGIKFPMEIHFVHIRADLSVQDALKVPDGLAIMAVFCNVFEDNYNGDFTAVDEVLQYLPALKKTGKRISGILLDITLLFSPNLNSYYAYAGSLTTPECNEAVTWLVFDKPVSLSDSQYQQFGKIGKEPQNARSLQIQGRQRVYRRPREKATPTILMVLQNVFRHIANFFKNMTSTTMDLFTVYLRGRQPEEPIPSNIYTPYNIM